MVLFFCVVGVQGQNILSNLNGYKIIYVPYQFNELVSYLSSKFREIGFKVYTDETALQGDTDYQMDPYLVLICQLETSYSYPHTTISVQLSNAKSQIVFQQTSNTRGKKFVSFNLVQDQNWVIDRIFDQFRTFRYSFDEKKSIGGSLPSLEQTSWTEESLKEYLRNNVIDQIEGIYKSYQTDKLGYYKIGIVKSGEIYKAVILETEAPHWKVGELKGIFEKSSMKDFYSIKWHRNNKSSYETFGKMDNDALLKIEVVNMQTGEKSPESFVKIFPTETTSFPDNNQAKASGSGFFISPTGLIGTNAHVVDEASRIEISITNEIGDFTYKAKVALIDRPNDVAILQIVDSSFTGLNELPYVFSTNSDVGAKVFTIGFPLNNIMGTNYKVTDGIISSNTGVGDDVRYLQISTPIQPGNSGGPLFNQDGNVIGITSAKLNSSATGTQVENVNYAIKISYLLNLFGMLPNQSGLHKNSSLSTKKLEAQVKILKTFVCLIRIY